MESICPGARRLIQPQIVFRACPNCGEEVEFFEYEVEQACPKCGKAVKKEVETSCVLWCQYAEKCLADIESRGLVPKQRVNDLRLIAASKRGEKSSRG
ncbi:MAG: hypothetical protein QXO32_00140 [Candidatus Bathyarchaeia archaeon]